MRLCYGSLLSIIKKFYSSYTLRDLNNMLIRSIDETYTRVSDGVKESQDRYASDLKNGHADIAKELKMTAKKKKVIGILDGVRKHCKSLLLEKDNNQLILILNQLIIQSKNIENDDIIILEPKTKKMNLVNLTSLDMDLYLANILYFIFVNAIPDESKKAKTGFDSRNHSSDFRDEEDYDLLIKASKKIISPFLDVSPLTTVEIYDFNSVFKEVSIPVSLTSKKPNDLKIYTLNVDMDGINYTELKEFIETNLGNYVYSRNETKELLDANKSKLIWKKAVAEFKKSKVFNGEELGNILLYSFLEYVLKAPKLFSNYEISKHGISISKAIHIQSINSSDEPYNILVFGASSIDTNLDNCIEKSFHQILESKENEEGSFKFVKQSIFNSSFDYATASKLKDIVLPSEKKSTYIQAGYGIFIGYKVNVDPLYYDTPEEYLNALQSQMKDDIISSYPKIEKIIKDNKLDKRSIYIYVLPFNDPTNDKDSIINEITSI